MSGSTLANLVAKILLSSLPMKLHRLMGLKSVHLVGDVTVGIKHRIVLVYDIGSFPPAKKDNVAVC
ncbi:hypothetical protein PSY31_23185, partial [Shigella flexneri]|nr:hypothetical protein [Shigella flexneri]